jgi:hypothetical protein
MRILRKKEVIAMQMYEVTALAPEGPEEVYQAMVFAEDESAETTERNVFYYNSILKKGQTSTDFTDKISISGDIAAIVGQTSQTDDNGLTTITTTYEYDGAQFVLEATVDAVQTHNAKDAIKSAWGVDVNISDDGALSLE